MGAQESKSSGGGSMRRSSLRTPTKAEIEEAGNIVIVSPGGAGETDVDAILAQLQALESFEPLLSQTKRRASLFSRADEVHHYMDDRALATVLGEFQNYCRASVKQILKQQRSLAGQIKSVEALCAKVIYLFALRSNEMKSSLAQLRGVEQVEVLLQEQHLLLRRTLDQVGVLRDALGGDEAGVEPVPAELAQMLSEAERASSTSSSEDEALG